MSLTTILLAVITVLALLVVHFRKKIGSLCQQREESSSWTPVRDSWAQLRGRVLNMVIADAANANSVDHVTNTAPHGKGGSMSRIDADVVCENACAGWASNPSVAVFCDCLDRKAIDF